MKYHLLLLSLCLLAAAPAAQQTVNIGTTANDGTGNNPRASFTKINENFTELYALPWYTITPAAGVGTVLAIAPNATGGLVTTNGTATLSNKTFVAPALGTIASGVATGLTGTAAGLTAGSVTTLPTLSGDVSNTGNVIALAPGVIVNADINASAAIALSKLATDPLARANHTGTQALSTISQSAATTNQVPTWSGTAWVPGTPAGSGDVTAAAAFGTDNRLIRSDGTGKGTQATGITVSDADAVTGVASIGVTGGLTAASLTIGATAVTTTGAELNFVSGVTSAIQAQLDAKAPLAATQTSTHAAPSTTNPLAPTWSGPTQLIWYGATGEIDLPAAAGYVGRGLILYNTGAYTVTFDPNLSEVIIRDGAVQAAGISFTLSTGAGNYVALVSDGARWITLGFKGTLTVGS